MKAWERLEAAIGRVEGALIVLLLGLMIAAAFSQIVLRNFFGIGLAWSEPLVRNLVLWVGFLGAARAARENRHIAIEVFGRLAWGRARPVVEGAAQGAAAVVCGLLAVAAGKFVRDDAQIGSRTLLDLPTWVPELIIPVAFALMALRFSMRAIGAFRPQSAPGRRSPAP